MNAPGSSAWAARERAVRVLATRPFSAPHRRGYFAFMDRATALRTLRRRDKSGEPLPNTVVFCTLSESKKTGGKIKTLRGVTISGTSWNLERNLSIALKRVDGKNFPNGSPRCPVKIPLLLRVNGEVVIG